MIKERVTVVFADCCIFVDEALKKLPIDEIADLDAHALHWFPETQSGVIEYVAEKNLEFTDERIVRPFLDAWMAEEDQAIPTHLNPTAKHDSLQGKEWEKLKGKRQPASIAAIVDALKASLLAAREEAEQRQREKEAAFQQAILDESDRKKVEKRDQDRIRFEKMVEEKARSKR